MAAADPDRATVANGAGFSRSDVTLGHRLAAMSPNAVEAAGLRDTALRLVVRYSRQVCADAQLELPLRRRFPNKHPTA